MVEAEVVLRRGGTGGVADECSLPLEFTFGFVFEFVLGFVFGF